MPIISASLTDTTLQELRRIQKTMGFSGRSEAIRAAIRMLAAESKEGETLAGQVRGILLLIHEHEAESLVTNVKHTFLDIIHTQLHNRFKEGKCLELFLLEGEADRVREMTGVFQKADDIEFVRLLIA
ncbi:CopG family ribbon-helix-helix protein [Candidatus Bathyarchaeota archaeon]|nr:CopG family ribbon-helix-helix protein [Candidatus Bathyarchaeota archaeon]